MSEIPRTFVNKENICTEEGIIYINNKDEIHHLLHVLRITPGDEMIILDGERNQYICITSEIKPHLIKTIIKEHEVKEVYPQITINLFQGLARKEKTDFIIQKSTELGVNRIIIINSEFAPYSLNNESQLDKSLGRWNKIALSAAKQSKRQTLPCINYCNTLDSALETIKSTGPDQQSLLCLENTNTVSLKQVLKKIKPIPDAFNIFIGPEGGWSEKEVNLFKEYNVKTVSLGDNILRTETAGLFMIGILLYEFEFPE